MNFPIRGAVIHNIRDMDETELREMITESIQRGEEKLLPGLGVLFEVIWEGSNKKQQDEMVDLLYEHLPREQAQPPISPS
ncbi:small acid-soluble spore protein SspI [Kroppenstedtia pulmonis]|uniref:Small, acid-soluble spore protein I n=1 Tax=Kroppenstedtia pulmonis TaxID=1380685 RepID=A0A7D4B202_9BACL|nr:small acid-soluble spore protein SspI [Kroppenstedtia pulmonis]QKG84006.1 small acid-soluble spore protein SspI [Kroppenstedtia pulmonis]